MDLEKIKQVIDLMNDNKLTEFTYEEHNKYKLTLKQGSDAPTVIDYVRSGRSELLAQSDWTQFPDSPLNTTKKTEWAVYRQALRDVPETYAAATSLDDIIWPTKPE